MTHSFITQMGREAVDIRGISPTHAKDPPSASGGMMFLDENILLEFRVVGGPAGRCQLGYGTGPSTGAGRAGATRGGYHKDIIPKSPVKPIRIWLEVGDRDLYNPNIMRDDMHDWVVANQNMAKVLAEKGYKYQFVFSRNSAHCDRATRQQTLPLALEWLWKDYRAK